MRAVWEPVMSGVLHHTLQQDKTLIFSKESAGTSGTMSGSEDTCCPLSLGILHYTSRVFCSVQCLGSVYTNMPTSNGVTIYSSKFPPTVSKHCQHQHSAIPNTIQAMWNINKPSCCVIQSAVSLVQHHGSFWSEPQQSLLWCLSRTANIQKS